MKSKLLTFLIICIAASAVIATEIDENELPKWLQGLGVAGGHYSGVGMSYKLIYDGKYGVQLTAGYYADEDHEQWAMPGIEFQYHLSRYKNTSFYISTGLSYEYYRYETYYWYTESVDTWYYEPIYETTEIWTTGIGFGIEAIFFDRISITAESIMFYRDNGRASVMIQGSLHYYFNMGNETKSERQQSQTAE